ncbi:hypothetical protein RCJ22_20285 [Vibrio sp. FNV 38]|nr:hypothetical protein [Vibrio sp. FNV 38]
MSEAEKLEKQQELLVTPSEMVNTSLVSLIDRVKSAPYERSSFYELHSSAGTFIEGAIPEDDVLVMYKYSNRGLNSSVVTLSFVDGKLFGTGSTVMRREAHEQLNALLDALKNNEKLSLKVRAFDGFNPYDRKRTQNAIEITRNQVSALARHIKLYAPTVLERTTFAGAGNSEILELGIQDYYYYYGSKYVGEDTSYALRSHQRPFDSKSWAKQYRSNFYEVYNSYSVRVEFEISEGS